MTGSDYTFKDGIYIAVNFSGIIKQSTYNQIHLSRKFWTTYWDSLLKYFILKTIKTYDKRLPVKFNLMAQFVNTFFQYFLKFLPEYQ
jgi:hypothetical protein